MNSPAQGPRPAAPASPASARAPAAVHLRLMGVVEMCVAGQAFDRWPSRAAACLLARLALQPGRIHPREELIELLWPGVDPAAGRLRFRQALFTLRATLRTAGAEPDTWLEAGREHLRVRPGVLGCDALEFEHAIRHGHQAQARAMYRGELMPGHYDEWIQDHRRHLAALHENLAPLAALASFEPDAPLPAMWTTTFGQEPHLHALALRVAQQRLVTLVGPGGCGKTRLALELAHRLHGARDQPPSFGRVAFVPLADCPDDAQAAATLARVLALPGPDPVSQMSAWLAGQPLLLVLDNLEQLPDAGAGFAMSLLERVPRLHLLVTSRRRCGVAGEQIYPLAGLPLPGDDPAELRGNPAVALFIDRALAVQAGFDASDAVLRDTAALVRLLGGMPLALELAASRVGSFSPARMFELLSRDGAGQAHLSLLSRPGPRSGHDARPAAMAEVIGWSWRLLSADEQALLMALAAFAGDAGLPGLAAVLDLPHEVVAARADDLVAHSMLQVVATGGDEPRFAMLEPVRDFVHERGGSQHLHVLRQGLLSWLLRWAQALPPAAPTRSVERELPSVQLMLADATLDAVQRLRLAVALRAYWDTAGLPASLQDALEQALHGVSSSSGLAATAAEGLVSDAHDLLAYQRFEAGFVAAAAEHADAAIRAAGDVPARRARALVRRAWVELAGYRSDHDGGPEIDRLQRSLEEALSLGEQVDDREAQARALQQLAALHVQVHRQPATAEALQARAQHLWAALGDRRKAAARLRNRAQCWIALGRHDEALACLQRCEREAMAEGDWLGQIDSLHSLAMLHLRRREWALALDLDRRCIALCWARWHRHGLAFSLWGPPLALARLRQPEPALRLMAFAARHWERHFGPLSGADRRTVHRVVRLVRAQVGERRAHDLWEDGVSMNIADAVALLLAPGGLQR